MNNRRGIRVNTTGAPLEHALETLLIPVDDPLMAAKPPAKRRPRPAWKPFYWVLTADMTSAAHAVNSQISRSIARNHLAPTKH
jgi:hypothetical protein